MMKKILILLVLFILAVSQLWLSAGRVSAADCTAVPVRWEYKRHSAEYERVTVWLWVGDVFVDGMEFVSVDGINWGTSADVEDVSHVAECQLAFAEFVQFSLGVLERRETGLVVEDGQYERFLRGVRPVKIYLPIVVN